MGAGKKGAHPFRWRAAPPLRSCTWGATLTVAPPLGAPPLLFACSPPPGLCPCARGGCPPLIPCPPLARGASLTFGLLAYTLSHSFCAPSMRISTQMGKVQRGRAGPHTGGEEQSEATAPDSEQKGEVAQFPEKKKIPFLAAINFSGLSNTVLIFRRTLLHVLSVNRIVNLQAYKIDATLVIPSRIPIQQWSIVL